MRLLSLFTLFFTLTAQAAHGPGDGGGGDEVGLEFQAALRSSLEIIRVSGRPEFAELVRLDWNKVTKGMKVLTVDRKLYVTVRGITQESAAVNHPESKLVEVNRARWKALTDSRKKEGLALHETLSLAGLESTGVYPYSGLYLSLFSYAPDPVFGGGGGGSGGPAQPVALPSEVSKVYPYRCQRRFLEGEGVVENQITCVPGQHLGFVTAEYTFYLYSRPGGNNFSSKLGERFYPSDICGLGNISKISCGYPGDAEYGLSARPEGAFVVGIQMTAAPEGEGPLTELYGYAALPDATGRCPSNLVEARPFVAQPQSVLEPLPTSFHNANNTLNNTVLSVAMPANFQVWRQPGVIPCDGTGRCSWPDGGMTMLQSVPYIALTPKICVVPKGALQ